MFHQPLNIVIALAMGAVVVVLVAGLGNLLRAGSPNRSQSLMRWRVGLQFLAILIIMGVAWLRGA